MQENFSDLLLRFSQERQPADRKAIEAQIWDRFGTELAVLVLDMSGFSRLAERYGVVHYLSMVRRMQITATPVISGYGGRVVKFQADNCFATFPDPLGAVKAATALNHAFDAANLVTPDELDIWISCGIDYGPILVVDGNDFFGNAVNVASKLGEDIAETGQILITQNARELVPADAGFEFEPQRHDVSGIAIDGFEVLYRSSTPEQTA